MRGESSTIDRWHADEAARSGNRIGTRVANAIIWPDGMFRPMTIRERIAWRFGRRVFGR